MHKKLPTSYGDGGVPPSLCTCNESGTPLNGTHLAAHTQACVACRLPEDGLLSRTKGLQRTHPAAPSISLLPGAEMPLARIPGGKGGCFFLFCS